MSYLTGTEPPAEIEERLIEQAKRVVREAPQLGPSRGEMAGEVVTYSEEFRCDEEYQEYMCDMCRAESTWRCRRMTPEASENRTRRFWIRTIVDRSSTPGFWESRQRFADPFLRIDDLLKDKYGPTYHPYERACVVEGRQKWEGRRWAVFGRGKPYRPRYKIAEELGVRGRDILHELLYTNRPLYALIPKRDPF